MNTPSNEVADKGFGRSWAELMIRFRWPVIAISLLVVLLASLGAARLTTLMDYRAFFSPQNPELQAFERHQLTYTKPDSFVFLVKPSGQDVFTPDTLNAIEDITEKSWQIPFAKRVDSLTNFQHTVGENDDLIVEDLFEGASSWTLKRIAERKEIALGEPLLVGRAITENGDASAVSVMINLPGESRTELPAAYQAAQALRDEVTAQYPELSVHLSGMSALNNAFATEAPNAMASLLPIMFGIIIVLSVLFLRSIRATGVMMLVVTLATMFAMGMAGFLGIGISPVSAAAPIVILTLAVADCMHITMSYRSNMLNGMPKREALIDAVHANLVAITVTSITTVIGFLALNFSDAPPFRALGNMSAIGIAAAWALSLTFFPAVASFVSVGSKKTTERPSLMRSFADLIINNYRKALLLGVALGAGFTAFVPTLVLNDQFTEYFDERVEFRQETDIMKEHFGPLAIDFSLQGRDGAGSVSDPEYLRTLDAFTSWLREQPKVTHVFSYSDIIKRLNRNMNNEDPAFFGVPLDRDLAAQYLLLYELSLPYGLDLNDRINIDKSASRITVSVAPIETSQTKLLLAGADAWLAENAPDYEYVATSPQVMFTYIADRNMQSMVLGTVIAIFAISLVIMFALRSFSLGALSIIPNGLPILSAFGAWAILVGEVGFSVASVGSISLGIVVDDTVHLLAKYRLARTEKGMSAEDAIRYSFENVGMAILANTVILVAGFMVLTMAAFKPTVDMGMLTAMAMIAALILDFLLLPALLLWTAGKPQITTLETQGAPHAA